MAECSNGVSQQSAEVNVMNLKNIVDSYHQLTLQLLKDNQENSRRRADNAATFDHLVNMIAAASSQVGTTEDQQTVSPIRLGAADTEVQQPAGAVYPPIRNVDQSAATAFGGIATAMESLAAAVANLQNSLIPVVTNAVGSASSPKS